LSCENDNFEIHIVLSCADRRPPNLQQTPQNLQRALRNKYVCNFLKPKLGNDLVRKIDTLVWELEQIDSLEWELEQIDSRVWELKQQLLGYDLVRKIDTLVGELEQIDSLEWELEQIDTLVGEMKQQLLENVEEEGSGAEENPPPQHFWPA